MDLIRTSLIFAIAITLYYLLLQWPVDSIESTYVNSDSNDLLTMNDSEQSLSETLSPLSSAESVDVHGAVEEAKYFEVQNNDLYLR